MCRDLFQVLKSAEIFSPFDSSEIISQPKTTITEWVENGTLNQSDSNALTVKLDGALANPETIFTQAFFGQLGAFINQVEAFVRSRRISVREGASWIDLANEAIDAIEE